jgi:hypothetical protein
MGPRNRRRVIAGAVSLLVVAAIAVAGYFLFMRSNGSQSASSAQTAHAPKSRPLVTQQIVYGMTKADVLRKIGKPTKTVGACWQYTENKSIWDGEHIINADRVCFLSGVYSYQYSKMDGEWNYPTDSINPTHAVG